ncbi:MAG: AAA family ATPase [Desulfobacteraceae bacterium]|nr:AAA family ATPase [Desulfobacteraceae bacterium]
MIKENQEALDKLIKKVRPPEKPKPKATPQGESNLDDNRLIDKMLDSQNGGKILRLLDGDWSDYSSQSEADQALCNHLAFWTGNSEGQIDRIFRTSGLMRDKWDKKHYGDGRTYGQATIEKAIASTGETYSGPTQKRSNNDRKGNKKRPKGVSLKDLKGQYDSKVIWIWMQHIAAALSFILNGREGAGKTTICLQIAKEIIIQYLQGFVVWLATEGAVADTVAKMDEIGLDNPRFVVAQKSDGSFKFDFYLKGDRDELDILLSDLPKPILAVFIDSIRGMSRYDDNDAGNGDLMHKINAIVCDKYRAALIYIDHHGKGRKDNLLDRNVWSTAKTSAVRGVLSVMPVSKFKRIIKPAKANISSMGGDLDVIKIGEKIIIQEPKVHSDETMKDKAEEFLINLFSKNSSIRSTEVYRMGEEEGFSGSLLKMVKKELGIESTRENRDSPWKWEWPLYTRVPNDSNDSKGVTA